MSTYWGYYCATCKESSPHWLNHGEHTLRELYTMGEHLTGLLEAGFERYGEIKMYGVWDEPDPAHWLQQHVGHWIELENEYGTKEPLE